MATVSIVSNISLVRRQLEVVLAAVLVVDDAAALPSVFVAFSSRSAHLLRVVVLAFVHPAAFDLALVVADIASVFAPARAASVLAPAVVDVGAVVAPALTAFALAPVAVVPAVVDTAAAAVASADDLVAHEVNVLAVFVVLAVVVDTVLATAVDGSVAAAVVVVAQHRPPLLVATGIARLVNHHHVNQRHQALPATSVQLSEAA